MAGLSASPAETPLWSHGEYLQGSGGSGYLEVEAITDSTCALKRFTFEAERPEDSWGSMLTCEFDLTYLSEIDGHRLVAVASDAVECGADIDRLYLILPKTVRRIENRAFRGDGAYIVLPDTLDYLGSEVFSQGGWECLLRMPKSLKWISARAFVNGGWDGTLPENLEYIGDNAFAGHSSYRLWTLIFPETLTYIGDNAFENCKKLESVVLPPSLEYLGVACFQNCSDLKSVALPPSLEKLQLYTFAGCSSLSTLELPYGLKEIGGFAMNDIAVSELSVPSSVETIGVSSMPMNLRTLTIEDCSLPLYVEHSDAMGGSSEWSTFESPVEYLYVGRDIQTESGCQAYFEKITTLRKVVIGEDVRTPGVKFYLSPKLESIELHTSNPPEVDFYDNLNGTYRNFTANQYRDVQVTVPQGSMTNYLLNPVWKNFVNIREGEYTGVSEIPVGLSADSRIYDITGRPVSSEGELRNGIYIIVNCGGTAKIIVR